MSNRHGKIAGEDAGLHPIHALARARVMRCHISGEQLAMLSRTRKGPEACRKCRLRRPRCRTCAATPAHPAASSHRRPQDPHHTPTGCRPGLNQSPRARPRHGATLRLAELSRRVLESDCQAQAVLILRSRSGIPHDGLRRCAVGVKTGRRFRDLLCFL